HELPDALPIVLGLVLHEIVFVGERPPDVAERGEPRDDITQVTIVLQWRHAVEAPRAVVVGMQQNDVGLDTELLQIKNAALEVLKELRIEARGVKVARRAGKRI